jgi:hypothetical protein
VCKLVMNKIHAAHFWVSMLATLDDFIDCENRFDFRMGASTLYPRQGFFFGAILRNTILFFRR